MEILKLIKKRRTIRKYKKKQVPKKILDKIIKAGRWASSIHGLQPWRFIVMRKKEVIEAISNILLKKSEKIGAGVNIILHFNSDVIRKTPSLIIIYSTCDFVKKVENLHKYYASNARIAEISAISAAIQNMILVAESLGIGSCWLDTPLFCEKEINKLLGVKNEKLVAILTLGYPAEKGKRSKRKPISETVKYL